MKQKIIIVDNNRDVCRIYEDTLNASGFQAISICNEEEAIDRICKEVPDLVLLDILMPKISGLHILDMIKQDQKAHKTHVIILTEITDSNIRDKAFRHGASDYLVKHEIDMNELLSRVRKVLG